MSQAKRFFSRVWNVLETRFSRPQVKREHVLLYTSLVMILVGSFLLRILPIFYTEILLKGLDPWIQYKCALFLNENGLTSFFNWYDQTSWFPYGRYMGRSMYIMIPFTAVIIYKIALFFGFNITMLTACYITPAIFGTLTVFVIYKLGSVLHSKRTGIFAAFFVAMATGFISRSIAGFFDNECIGIFLMFLIFYFFVKGLTKDSMVNNVLAGICLGLLSITWGAYKYAWAILALYALLMIVLQKFSRRLFSSYSVTILLGTLIFTLVPRNALKRILNTEIVIPLLLIGVMLLIIVYQELKKNVDSEQLKRIVRVSVFIVIGGAIISAILFYALGIINPIATKFLRTIIPTLAGSLPLIESVAENTPSTWSHIFFNVYVMVFFLPLGFYFCIKKPTEKTVFLLLLGLTATYFVGSMVRLSLIFTPAAALLSGYTLDEVLRPFALINQDRFTISKRKRRAVKQIGRELISVAYIFVAVILLFTAIFGVNMTNTQYAQTHELTPRLTSSGVPFYTHDYQETFDFIKYNIAPYNAGEKPPVIMSWWDYGYQINVMGNCTTVVDNATINGTQIGLVGSIFMHNLSYSNELCKKYNIDYVLVLGPGIYNNRGNDLAKSQWMMQIAEDEIPEMGIRYSDYYNQETFSFTDKFWDSLCYKLCGYRLTAENGRYNGDDGAAEVRNWRTGYLQGAPQVSTIEPYYDLVFESHFAILRIYQVI